MRMEEFLEEVAKGTPTPGGGSIAALSGAIACSLAEMVCNLTIGKKKYKEVEEDMVEIRNKINAYRKRFFELIEEDARAFNGVIKAFRESGNVHEAYKKAAEVPYETAKIGLALFDYLKEIAIKGNKNAISDVGVAGYMAFASFHSALLNVKINLGEIEKDYSKEMEKKINEMEKEMENKFKEVMEEVKQKINYFS